MKQTYTLVIFTENKIGLINRIAALFIQRHINIDSLTTSESEYEGIHRFTVVIEETEEKVSKIVKQIEKQVEVLKAFYFTDSQTVFTEVALYKVKLDTNTDRAKLDSIIERNKANVKAIEGDFLLIEKTGLKNETHGLFEELNDFNLHGFVRSGRISLSKTISTFSLHLRDLERYSKEVITN